MNAAGVLLPLLAGAGAALVFGLWAGLVRAGVDLEPLRPHHVFAHGPLMIGGFLGTLIALEKAIALGRAWGFLAPLLGAAGGLSLVATPQASLAALLWVAASAILAAVLGVLLTRRFDAAGLTMLAGALALLVGQLLWLSGRSPRLVASWWLAFPVFVIVGERLELSRVLAPRRSAAIGFATALAVCGAGLILLELDMDAGQRVLGGGFLLLALWLLRHDLARRTVRLTGSPRYTAICLLSGYLWLGAAGLMAALWGADLGGWRYDALIHAVALGFVFAMIFGHVPIIAPMLLQRRLAWTRALYVPLLLLHASLLLRVGGDLAQWLPGRSWGALSNGAAILLFVALTARAVAAGERIGGG